MNFQVLVKITDVNDNAPVFSRVNYRTSVSESASLRSAVLRVSATDADQVKHSLRRAAAPSLSSNSGALGPRWKAHHYLLLTHYDHRGSVTITAADTVCARIRFAYILL